MFGFVFAVFIVILISFVHSCCEAVFLACDFHVYFHFCCYRCPNTRLAEKRKWVTPCRNIDPPGHLTGSFDNIITQSMLHHTTPSNATVAPCALHQQRAPACSTHLFAAPHQRTSFTTQHLATEPSTWHCARAHSTHLLGTSHWSPPLRPLRKLHHKHFKKKASSHACSKYVINLQETK